MLLQWFVAAFVVTVVGMAMKFFFVNYNPVKIGMQNSFRLQKRSLKNILNMSQTVYAKRIKDIILICAKTVRAHMGICTRNCI